MGYLAGYTGNGLERTVKLRSVTGFLDRISVALRQQPNIKTASSSKLIPSVRVLVTDEASGMVVVPVKQHRRESEEEAERG